MGKGSQNMLSIVKKETLTANQIGLPKPFPFRDIYLYLKKLLKFWHFVSPRAPIPPSDMFFKEQEEFGFGRELFGIILFYTYNPKTSLAVLFEIKLLWSAFKLEFTCFFISKPFMSNTRLKFSKRLRKS